MTDNRQERRDAILEHALELLPVDRGVYLAEACGEDIALRAEIEDLLAANERMSSVFLDNSASVPLLPIAHPPALASGDVLSARFEVEALIGTGGMGEVYRARDRLLNRYVALKMLAPAADLRARLEREARAVSALAHPHICSLYDLESDGAQHFLVMEYLEGETLADRLRRGHLPYPEWWRIADELTEALAYAHRCGIVHRDLKPGNVMLTDAGVKLLDFGLAKRSAHFSLESAKPDALRLASFVTATGMIFGTVSYMSPEQAEGQAVDARSDLFSFGCVLYEMVTGRQAFPGNSPISILGAILRGEPQPVRELAPLAPAGFEQLIARCLRKNPKERFRNVEDLRQVLAQLQPGMRPRRRFLNVLPAGPRAVAWILAVVLLIAATGILLYLRPITNIAAGLPNKNTRLNMLATFDGEGYDPALSPDGKMIAYAAEEQGRIDLFVSRVAGGGRVRLTNDDARESSPCFSPDGERIAFSRIDTVSRAREIWILPALGGNAVRVLRDATDPAWAPDGSRLAFIAQGGGRGNILATAASDGSDFRILCPTDARYPSLRHPSWSHDGTRVVFVRSSGGALAELWIASLTGSPPQPLFPTPQGHFSDDPVFTSDGRAIIYDSNRAGTTNLWMASLNGRQTVRLTTGPGPDSFPTVSRNGSIAFISSRHREAIILFQPANGASKQLLTHLDILWAPAFSPDGRQLAFTRAERDGSWDIWTSSLDGTGQRRLTSGAPPKIYPRFTPDGAYVLYQTWTSGPNRIWRVATGGGAPTPVTPENENDEYGDVSPDGQSLAFARTEGALTRVFIGPFGGGPAKPLTPNASTLPRWSPDGHWIAFSGGRSHSTGGIFVVRQDGTELRRLSETGSWPVWWPDGKRVAYLGVSSDGTQEIRTVDVATGVSELLRGLRFRATNAPFDISRDGAFIATSDVVQVSSEIWLLEPQ
jgi:Tol biopolymer transport system component